MRISDAVSAMMVVPAIHLSTSTLDKLRSGSIPGTYTHNVMPSFIVPTSWSLRTSVPDDLKAALVLAVRNGCSEILIDDVNEALVDGDGKMLLPVYVSNQAESQFEVDTCEDGIDGTWEGAR